MALVRVKTKMHMRSIRLNNSWDKRGMMDRLDEAFECCSFCHCPEHSRATSALVMWLKKHLGLGCICPV